MKVAYDVCKLNVCRGDLGGDLGAGYIDFTGVCYYHIATKDY